MIVAKNRFNMHEFLTTALSIHLPPVMRWAGAVAKRLRSYDIAVEGKKSGSAATDALTLADLSLQELIVAALRDADPIFRHCRIEAEESTGDLARFPTEADLTIGIDPIDGTKKYRDRSDHGYSVMLHLRSKATVLYSLVYQPERGPDGWWIEARDEQIVSGPDDHSRPAADQLRLLQPVTNQQSNAVPEVYMTGFMQSEPEVVRQLKSIGVVVATDKLVDRTPYELIAAGELCGALIHSPNVYDFPVTLHLCRILGGDAVWTHNGESVHFHQTWLDTKSNMVRLPGIVACSSDPEVLKKMATLAKDWSAERYRKEMELRKSRDNV